MYTEVIDDNNNYTSVWFAAYLLSDAGYDVWMGNFRGNIYSRRHLNLTHVDPSFWRFRWEKERVLSYKSLWIEFAVRKGWCTASPYIQIVSQYYYSLLLHTLHRWVVQPSSLPIKFSVFALYIFLCCVWENIRKSFLCYWILKHFCLVLDILQGIIVDLITVFSNFFFVHFLERL